jgi:DNA polymerase-3 subunit delta'
MEAGSHPDFRFVLPDALEALRPGHAAEQIEDDDGKAETEAVDKSTRASREIRVDQVRALGNFANLATHRGGLRVILIAPAEALNGPAANALLKLLEEPAARTLLLLVTDSIDELLPTIRSRCMLVRTEAPTWETGAAWLAEQGAANAETALAEAGGAPLLALEAATRGAVDAAWRERLLEALARGDAPDVAGIGRALPREIAVAPALALMQRWCWDLLGCRVAARVRYHRSHQAVISRLAGKVCEDRLWAWTAALNKAQASSEHPLNARLVVESMLLRYQSIFAATR